MLVTTVFGKPVLNLEIRYSISLELDEITKMLMIMYNFKIKHDMDLDLNKFDIQNKIVVFTMNYGDKGRVDLSELIEYYCSDIPKEQLEKAKKEIESFLLSNYPELAN